MWGEKIPQIEAHITVNVEKQTGDKEIESQRVGES